MNQRVGHLSPSFGVIFPPPLTLLTMDTQRREAWQAVTRRAGHHALPAHTLARALVLLSKVRPSLVLADVVLDDGRVLAFLRHLRATEPLKRVVVVVLGDLSVEEQEHIAADARSYTRPRDAPIGSVLDEFLATA